MGENSSNTSQVKTKSHGKAYAALELIFVFILSGSIFYEYVHNTSLQSYVRNAIQSNTPILQFALPVGVAAIGGSLFLQRRKEARESQAALLREELLTRIRFGEAALPHAESIPHYRMVFESPEDTDDVALRRTNKKGRLSRNRAAERLPPED